MEKVKMKYVGKVPTRVLTERNGEKVAVNEGDVVEVDKDIALQIAKAYKDVWIPEGTPIKKHEAEVEGGLDESKVEKAVPKKRK